MRARLVATSLVALALAACTSSTAGDFTAVTDGATTALVSTQSGSGMEAQVRGRLVHTADGCVALDSEGGEVPVVWPRGTSLDGGAIVLPSGARLGVGDEVDGGGGYVSVSSLTGTVPEACSGLTVVVVSTIDPAGR